MTIKNQNDLRLVRDCTHITGSLTIALEDSAQPGNNFDNIREIRGYLAIIGHQKITNLSFLRNLKVIHGDELYTDKYALFLLYNNDMEHLFSKSFEVRRGSLFVSMNPSLCNSKVLRFQHQISEISGSCCDVVAMGNDEEC